MLHELKEQLISLCQPFIDWCSSFGEMGLFALAMIEAIFFPVPPDMLLIPMVYSGNYNEYLLALICTLGSVFGAIVGYLLGKYASSFLLEKLGNKKINSLVEQAKEQFNKYGSLAILLAAFTPLPYKVFAWTAGILNMNLRAFILYSFLGRAARFFAFAFLIANFGEMIMQNFFKLSLLLVFFALIWLWWQKTRANYPSTES